MSVLVVGLSHKSAPVLILERAALSGDALGKLLGDVFQASDVAGSFVVSSCNRVEVDAEVANFHGSVSAISELLARHSGVPLPELTRHLHAPTVRVKELAGSRGGDSYEAVLRVLFDLDPEAVQTVTRADAVAPGWQEQEVPK